jgi:hypothetical protein
VLCAMALVPAKHKTIMKSELPRRNMIAFLLHEESRACGS